MTIMAICIFASTLSTNVLMNLSNLTEMKSAVLDPKSRISTARTINIKKKREQAQLETQISKLLAKKLRMEAYIASIITDEFSSATTMSEITEADNYSGGKSDKVSNKVNKS